MAGVKDVVASPRLLFLAFQAIALHTASAALHEQLFHLGLQNAWFLTFLEFTFYAAMAAVQRKTSGRGLLQGFHRDHLLCGVTMAVSHTLTNEGFMRLNFPTATLFRSSKVVFVMAGSWGVLGRKISLGEFLSAAVLCLGLGVFGLADKMSSPKFDLVGCACCFASLCGASLLSNVQERALRRCEVGVGAGHSSDLVFFQYSVGAMILLPVCVGTGELQQGLSLMYDKYLTLVPTFLGFVVCLYCGLRPLLRITTQYDATTTQVVTALRRVCTFILSFVLFPKEFSWMHGVGVAMALSGAHVLHRLKQEKSQAEKKSK